MKIQPITRKERFLNEIVGWGETVPEKPTTPEEFFFAAILGEAVQAPEPLTRYQMYLAKIAGRNISVPKPLTRLELFLAKACGMDIETPTPITREEIFWANYKGIEQIIEGVPPLMFKSNGANLSNYRIYGNTVNGESVGNLVESGEHTGEYLVPVTINSNTTSIYLPHQIRKVGDELEYIDYEEQKQHRVRKNLLQNTATSRTLSTGITVTVNDNKSVVVNGTSSTGNPSGIILGGNVVLDKGAYILSGCPQGGSNSAYKLYCIFDDDGERKVLIDTGDGATIVLNGDNPKVVDNGFYIYALSCDNNVFFPMLRKADITDDTYEPYIENTDLDVTLPALPTLSGTNTLSFETTVQPSKVMIKTGKFGTHKVRYYDSDGTFLSAEDVKDGTNAQGFTPTKTSTAQYNYTFMGWSTTKGSTTAGTGVLNDITADKSLYAVFSQSLRTFTVYFYNGSTLLQTAENVQYGGTATYTGETPTKDGFTFSGWQPSNVNITADTSCYAQFVEG